MKKICLLLAACLLLSCFAGCGAREEEPTEPTQTFRVQPLEGAVQEVDLTGLKAYEADCGISFYGPSGMKQSQIDGLAAYYKSSLYIMMVIKEPRTGTVLENVTLQEYADMLAGSNGLEPFVTDCYGSLATTNVAQGFDEGDGTFFYYVTVKEGSDCFWLIQFACLDELMHEVAGDMTRWSATVTETVKE